MNRILVTGGAGFIGSHLVERLLLQGHAVHIVDALWTNAVPFPDLLTEWQHLPLKTPLANLTYDLCSTEQFANRRVSGRFDEIYHLASPVGPAGVLAHAGEMVRRIVADTYHLADLALWMNARLLDVSTSEVYGGGVEGLCAEETPKQVSATTTVRLEYAVAKLAAETALANLSRTKGLDAVIVRPFNVAGPRQGAAGGFVLPRFVGQALRGEGLTVFGDGSQVRAFTHVSDIVEGLLHAMQYGRRGEAYNLGNPDNKTTIRALAERVIRWVGDGHLRYTSGKAVYGPLWEDAPDKYPDATKALRDLRWLPWRNIDDTIRDVIAYETREQVAA